MKTQIKQKLDALHILYKLEEPLKVVNTDTGEEFEFVSFSLLRRKLNGRIRTETRGLDAVLYSLHKYFNKEYHEPYRNTKKYSVPQVRFSNR